MDEKFAATWEPYFVTVDGRQYWLYPEIYGLKEGLRDFIYLQRVEENESGKFKKICMVESLNFSMHKSCNIAADGGFIALLYRAGTDPGVFLQSYYSGMGPEIGKFLGYPDCCRKFHDKIRPQEGCDIVPTYLASVKPFPWLLNITRMDPRLISHFPCSFSCHKSIEMAKRVFGGIESHAGKKSSALVAEILKFNSVHYKRGILCHFDEFNVAHYVGDTRISNLLGVELGSEMTILKDGIKLVRPDKSVTILKKGVMIFDFSRNI